MTTDSNVFPLFPNACAGLEDHSEELDELSERDRQTRLYRAMAKIDSEDPALVGRLCEVVATAVFDLCAIHLRAAGGATRLVWAHDVNPTLGARIRALIADDLERHLTDMELRLLNRDGVVEFQNMTLRGADPRVELNAHSVLVLRLPATNGVSLGTLMVARHATSRAFTATDLALLQWIASTMGMKLETNRLRRDLRNKNRALSKSTAELRSKAEALTDAVRARDDFIAAAAHELKTPLSTLDLQTEIVRRAISDQLPDGDLQHNVDAMQRQVHRLNRLVSRLLDTSQLKAGQLTLEYELVGLHELGADVVERFRRPAEQQGIELAFHATPVCGYWDADRLDQVMSNLLSNALKYTKRGRIEVSISRTAESAVIDVRDDGDGIPMADIKRIFEQFERGPNAARQSGLGLGLWIASHIVQRLGGSITVHSEPGVGSRFEVVLPIEPASH